MGQDDDIARVFLALRGSLSRAIRHIVPPKEIEDIVQETYVSVCRLDGKRAIRSPRSFMFKTARNLALDHAKRAGTRLSESYDETADGHVVPARLQGDDTFEQACSEVEFSRFCDAVRYLPTQCRRAFVLRKVYGYSQKEIAKVMRISEGTVEKHIAEGIRRCTHYMAGKDRRRHVTRSRGNAAGGSRRGFGQ